MQGPLVAESAEPVPTPETVPRRNAACRGLLPRDAINASMPLVSGASESTGNVRGSASNWPELPQAERMAPSGAQEASSGHSWPTDFSCPDARPQPRETFDHPAWTKSRSCAKPMVERLAGSGVYYRASVIAQAQDQLYLYFPSSRDKQHECHGTFEWVFNTSSRLLRKQYRNNEWRYIRDGAWELKSNSKLARGKRNRARRPPAVAAAPTTDGATDVRCDENDSEGRDVSGSHEAAAAEQRGDSHNASNSSCSLQTMDGLSDMDPDRAIAMWFCLHVKAMKLQETSQAGDRCIAWGPTAKLQDPAAVSNTANEPSGTLGLESGSESVAEGDAQQCGKEQHEVSDEQASTQVCALKVRRKTLDQKDSSTNL